MAPAAGMTAGIDVAIVAYRRWDLTTSCLDHLARQTVPHHVVLCDNGCDEGTAERARARYPHVEVLRLARNMPYPIACNAAVAAGSGELVVMMNNDVDARPDFLERLTAPFGADAGVGSVASVLLRPGESVIDSVGLVADPILAGFARYQGQPAAHAAQDDTLLTGPAGAAAAFRRAAWEQIGGMDERIPAYMEDFELALRLRQAGWSTALARDAIAVHIGGATFGHRSAGQRWRSGYARGYLLRRYGLLRGRTAPRALATEAIVAAADIVVSRDTAAARGRVAGWRSARGLPHRPWPPPEAIDHRIGFLDSLRRRRGAYASG
ncbi:MAG: glycosyltransferase family 2 protein [Solirubrobacteraceae bacterium]